MNDGHGYYFLLKVRIGRKLNTEQKCLAVIFGNRQVTIRSEKQDQALNESTWIVLDARGFATEDEARDFSSKLRDAVSVGALCSRIGADPDQDEVRALRSDVVDFMFSVGQVEVTVRTDPARFIGALTVLADPLPLDDVRISVRLLNLAMLNTDRIGKIILAISAVESLVDDPGWSADEQQYIEDLVAQTASKCSDDIDFRQIAEAIRNIRHTSVRRGIRQCLDDDALFKEWDNLYRRRSRLVHGTKPLDRQELSQLASDAIRICTKILLISLKRKGASLPENATTHFGSL